MNKVRLTGKLNRLKPERQKLDPHSSDEPEVSKLKEDLLDAADKVKKEGIS